MCRSVRNDSLKLVGAGLVLALVGSLRMAKDVQVVTHSTGQPVFSWGWTEAFKLSEAITAECFSFSESRSNSSIVGTEKIHDTL
jgi:hypothetical protein